MDRKKKIILLLLIITFLVLVFCFLILLIINAIISNNEKQNSPLPTPIIEISPTLIQKKEILIFNHIFLPKFSFSYPEDWQIETKEFKTPDIGQFVSKYFLTCHERCMGVRLTKQGVSLELIFDVAFDDFGTQCSNTVDFSKLKDTWYRIKDSSGVYYYNQISIDFNTGENGGPEFGDIKDEWSYIDNTSYKICKHNTGSFLELHSNVEATTNTPDGKVPILMETPLIKGTPTPTFLEELDQIILSIKGLAN